YSALPRRSLRNLKIVLQVFDDVRDEYQVEMRSVVIPRIDAPEMKALVGLGPAPVQGLRRNVVAPEFAVGRQRLLQPPEHFTGAAANLADGSGGEIMPAQHPQQLFGFPRRLLRVPARIPREILA